MRGARHGWDRAASTPEWAPETRVEAAMAQPASLGGSRAKPRCAPLRAGPGSHQLPLHASRPLHLVPSPLMQHVPTHALTYLPLPAAPRGPGRTGSSGRTQGPYREHAGGYPKDLVGGCGNDCCGPG